MVLYPSLCWADTTLFELRLGMLEATIARGRLKVIVLGIAGIDLPYFAWAIVRVSLRDTHIFRSSRSSMDMYCGLRKASR